MLESSVVFGPRFYEAHKRAPALLWASRRRGEKARCWRPSHPRTQKALLVYLLGDHHPPGAPQELVSFCRSHSPFFRLKPRRFNHRRMVGSLTLSPVLGAPESVASL